MWTPPAEDDLERSPSVLLRAGQEALRGSRFEWTVLGIFAALLSAITLRHEMWRDELQAWLIARDSHTLSQLFHVLHYEGHPSLWYLLLWIPAHLSPNPASMQVINCLIAVILAWVILSDRNLKRPVRVLIVFSFFVFYQFGVEARSYELAFLLLVASARCIVGGRRQRRLAILLLALSLNTHAFAAPVAVALAAWGFYFARLTRWRDAGRLLRDREFLTAVVSLGVAGTFALFTAWPASDIVGPNPGIPAVSSNLLHTVAELWLTFFPRLPRPAQMMLMPLRDSIPASCIFSAAMLAVVVLLLESKAARIFFVSCALMEIPVISLTVKWPSVYHLGFVFIAFVIALMLDHPRSSSANPHLPWIPRKISSASILLLLLCQLVCTADAFMLDWIRPFSDAKEASDWLKANHLDRNPLVLQPSEVTNGIVAYLERPGAYFPSCRCYASYELRNTARQVDRRATLEELKSVRGGSPLSVILISNEPLELGYIRSLDLVEIHSTAQNSEQSEEIFYIYEQSPPR